MSFDINSLNLEFTIEDLVKCKTEEVKNYSEIETLILEAYKERDN